MIPKIMGAGARLAAQPTQSMSMAGGYKYDSKKLCLS
jgi:hypothetical protein